jgi:hypothetical protein
MLLILARKLSIINFVVYSIWTKFEDLHFVAEKSKYAVLGAHFNLEIGMHEQLKGRTFKILKNKNLENYKLENQNLEKQKS